MSTAADAPASTISSSPDRPAVLLWAGAVAVVAFLDGWAVLRALGTVLHDSCGNDWAWAGVMTAAAVASLSLVVVTVGMLRWWWSQRRPPWFGRWHRDLMLLIVIAVPVAVAAATWLPDGSCV